MSDDTTAVTEQEKAAAQAQNTTAAAEEKAPVPYLTRLQTLEAQARDLLGDLKLKAEKPELETAELKLSQFVHELTIHLGKLK